MPGRVYTCSASNKTCSTMSRTSLSFSTTGAVVMRQPTGRQHSPSGYFFVRQGCCCCLVKNGNSFDAGRKTHYQTRLKRSASVKHFGESHEICHTDPDCPDLAAYVVGECGIRAGRCVAHRLVGPKHGADRGESVTRSHGLQAGP